MAHDRLSRWHFFLGACFLTGSIVVPRAGLKNYAAGVVLAGCVQCVLEWLIRGGE